MSGVKASAFPSDDAAFFFRKGEQRYLFDRVKYSGVTVIKGGPRSGKSWLVGHVLRQLNNKDWPQPLIGFCRCSAQDSDNLGRVIDDLAISWRKRANLFDQAKEIFKQNIDNWPQIITRVVARLIDSAEPFGLASSLVADTLKHLPGLEPGSHAPRLKYEHGQELIKVLAEITSAEQVILVLDQWEHSINLKYELEHLQNFSRDWKDWPHTHFLITIQSGGEAEHLLREFCTGQPGFIAMYSLPAFETGSDPDERERLIAYLTDNVPACRSVHNPDQYLLHIQGYPAVLDNWTRPFNKDSMQNLEDLVSVANQARRGMYPEFERLVPQLPTLTRKLSIRLGLLPNITDESWTVLSPILMEGIEPHCLDDLFSKKLLEGIDPPSFGHQQRSDDFQRWLLDQRKAETGEQCRILVRKLAGKICEVSPATLPFLAALVALAPRTKELMKDVLTEGLCEAAISWLRDHTCGDALLRGKDQWCASGQADVVKLVVLGLFNIGLAAKEEHDLSRRDAVLDELRRLAQAHPTDATVREWLARGLVSVGLAVKKANDLPRQNALLNELRQLAQAHPTDAVVREWLARGLTSTGLAAQAENDLSRRDAVLNELRRLAQAHPTDAVVRICLEVLMKVEDHIERDFNGSDTLV